MQDIRRRAVLGMGLAAATAAVPGCSRRRETTWRFFTPEEARIVDEICEQLIPRDQDPGAHDTGVVNYIDIQLANRHRRYRKIYREGLSALDADCRTKFHKAFTELEPEQQAEILRGMDENGSPFFELILNHTRQGFYGDPRHGGNRNMASWKMVGLPFPPVRGRQQAG